MAVVLIVGLLKDKTFKKRLIFQAVVKMAEKQKIGSAKRFGPRYGRKLRLKVGAIEKEQRRLHKCPYCNYVKVKRVAVGIWGCGKCGSKFAGKAYSPGDKK